MKVFQFAGHSVLRGGRGAPPGQPHLGGAQLACAKPATSPARSRSSPTLTPARRLCRARSSSSCSGSVLAARATHGAPPSLTLNTRPRLGPERSQRTGQRLMRPTRWMLHDRLRASPRCLHTSSLRIFVFLNGTSTSIVFMATW